MSDQAVTRKRVNTRKIRLAATSGFSCAHILKTFQPADRSAALCLVSRPTFSASFLRHHRPCRRGQVACLGQACQKQPSTNAASRALGKTRSTLTGREAVRSRTCFRYRKPRAWRARRTASSGAESVGRLESMERRTPGLDAHDRPRLPSGATIRRRRRRASSGPRCRWSWPRPSSFAHRSRTSRERAVTALLHGA